MTQVRGAAETPDRRILRARVLKGKVKLAQPQHRRGIALLDRSNQHLFGAADIARNIFAVGIAFSDERSEEHTSELQSLMRISYAVFCLNKKKHKHNTTLADIKNQISTQN